jgi:hypothetical protein
MKCLRLQSWWRALVGSALLLATLAAGCSQIPSAHTNSRNYSYGDAPVDPPQPGDRGKFDDYVKGGELFKMSCGSCHNQRPLGERPFSNAEICMAHMRESAYLTGKEYRQLMLYMRRWHDVGPPTPDVPPSPKRFFFSQPITELRDKAPAKAEKDAAPPAQPGKEDDGANGRP